MHQAFPQFTATLTKAFYLQSLELSDKELINLSAYSEDSYDFYKLIMKCKDNELKANFTCISNSFKDTPCASELNDLAKCKTYLQQNLLSKSLDPSFCSKQDRNFSSCVNDLSSPIIFLKSHLPLRSSQLS